MEYQQVPKVQQLLVELSATSTGNKENSKTCSGNAMPMRSNSMNTRLTWITTLTINEEY